MFFQEYVGTWLDGVRVSGCAKSVSVKNSVLLNLRVALEARSTVAEK